MRKLIRPWMLAAGLLAAGLLATAQPLVAQTIRGTVVLRDGVQPAPGVIVVATAAKGAAGAAGASGARGLTSATGAFVLRLPAPGRYDLRVLRIGYRPTIGPTVDVAANAIETVRIVFSAEAVVLTAVNVRDRSTCRVNADTGLMVTRVWGEARKAMLSTQLSTGDAPLYAEWIEYDRTLDSSARIVRGQRVRTSRNPTTHAFKSRPADQLSENGYVVSDGGSTMYYAPDADVLLSDRFATEHCFRLQAAPKGSPGLIGVRFEPSRNRRDRRDIQGTLWLDRETAELRSLEFTFTNLSSVAEAAGAGGRVEFLKLLEGSWLIDRWSLRMPQLEARGASDNGLRRTIMASNPVVRAIQMTGGEVTLVSVRDSVIYRAVGPHVALQVIAPDSIVGVAGATLTLDGTDYSGLADASGVVRLSPVLAGRYRAQVRTPLMDSLGMPAVSAEVETHTDGHVDSLSLPRARDFLARVCPKDSIAHGEGMLHGTVWTEEARAVPHAGVVVTWQANISIIGGAAGDQLSYSEATLGTLADEAGNWRICGVPREKKLMVRVVSDSGSDLRMARLDDDFATLDLVARRAGVSQLSRDVEIAMGVTNRPQALVELAVFNLSGAPLPDATLDVHPASGPVRTVITGPSGRALLPGVAPGRLTVRARRVGFKPGDLVTSVEAGRNTIPIILSTVALPTLDTMRVVGGRVAATGRLDGFEQRRLNSNGGYFVTRTDIEKQAPTATSDLLRRIPGVMMADSSHILIPISARGMKMVNLHPVQCPMRVGIDGFLRENGFDLNTISPNDIHGIEIYDGPASMPPQFNGAKTDSFCGLIMIWTRSGS